MKTGVGTPVVELHISCYHTVTAVTVRSRAPSGGFLHVVGVESSTTVGVMHHELGALGFGRVRIDVDYSESNGHVGEVTGVEGDSASMSVG